MTAPRAVEPDAPPGLEIRREVPGDEAAVHRLNALAFGQPAEAELVDALRDAGAATLSLVAVRGGEVIGHILFSPVTVEPPSAEARAVGLAPMAVLPGLQRGGIGSALVRAGLAILRDEGHGVVVVLGHPEYYPRFGFAPGSAFGLRCEYEAPEGVFRVLELRPGALGGRRGLVRYRPEFRAV